MNMTKIPFVSLFVSSLLLLSGCGGGGGDDDDTNNNNGGNTTYPVSVNNDSYQFEKNEEQLLDILSNDTIPTAANITIAIEGVGGDEGTAVVEDRQIRYTAPNTDDFEVSFSYTVSDTVSNTTDTATVTITPTITPPPEIDAQPDKGVTSINQEVLLDVLNNDTSTGGENLVLQAIAISDRDGVATLQDNQILYTPPNNYFGVKSLSYTVGDGNDNSVANVNVDILIEEKLANLYAAVDTSNIQEYNLSHIGATVSIPIQQEQPANVSSAGQFNNDNYDDVVVCFSEADTETDQAHTNAGICYLILGSADPLPASTSLQDLAQQNRVLTLQGAETNMNLGNNISFLGDINNDTYDDISISVVINERTSAILIFGRAQLPANTTISLSEDNITDIDGFTFVSSEQSYISVGGIGNFDGDAYPDLVATVKTSQLEKELIVIYGRANFGRELDLAIPLTLDQGFKIVDTDQIPDTDFDFNYRIAGGALPAERFDNAPNDLLINAFETVGDVYHHGVFVMKGGERPEQAMTHLNENGFYVKTSVHIRAQINNQDPSYNIVPNFKIGNNVEQGYLVVGYKDPDVQNNQSFVQLIALAKINQRIDLNNDQHVTDYVSLTITAPILSPISALYSVDDMNNDDLTDLVVFNPSTTNPSLSKAYIVFGGDTLQPGIDLSDFKISSDGNGNGTVGVTLENGTSGTVMGWISEPVGDFNNDGKNDFAIGGYSDQDNDVTNEFTIIYSGFTNRQ
jgi:Bacterial Ig domain